MAGSCLSCFCIIAYGCFVGLTNLMLSFKLPPTHYLNRSPFGVKSYWRLCLSYGSSDHKWSSFLEHLMSASSSSSSFISSVQMKTMSEITVSWTERHKSTNICPWKYTKWQQMEQLETIKDRNKQEKQNMNMATYRFQTLIELPGHSRICPIFTG